MSSRAGAPIASMSMSEPTPHDHRRPAQFTRRAVLLSGAGAALLAACGSSPSSRATATTSSSTSLLAFFPVNDYLTAGAAQRAAFGVADAGGGLSATAPASLRLTLTGPGGFVQHINVTAHRKDLPWSYYPVAFTPPKAGSYTASAVVDGSKATATFTVAAKGASEVPGPTDAMPKLETPTTGNTLGVDPICTADPVCPLHTVSLDAALAEAKPVAYLVATPKFCQTGICGPVLDVLLSVRDRYAGRITFIHQEVYQSATDAAEKGAAAKLTKAVTDLGLTSEPVLFLVGKDGVVASRLDGAYDADELTGRLDALVG